MGTDILIVDDEPAVRELLKMVLRTIDVSIREAADGVEALDQIKQSLPKMVILDVMMPRMDGLTALKQLRENPATASLPVLLFTAYRVPAEKAAELSVPPSMIMNKGTLSIKDLRAVVTKTIQAPPPRVP